jgi:hypothetical protein
LITFGDVEDTAQVQNTEAVGQSKLAGGGQRGSADRDTRQFGPGPEALNSEARILRQPKIPDYIGSILFPAYMHAG